MKPEKIKIEITPLEAYVLNYVLNQALRTFTHKENNGEYYSKSDFVVVLTGKELKALKDFTRRV